MSDNKQIVCIGSVLWDVIGRAPVAMRQGSDVAGRIERQPGGVVMNIASTLARFGLHPELLTVIGRDAEGDELIAACRARGLSTAMVYRSQDLPTDRYMAIEGANGLIAAIADAHSLEAVGARILEPLGDGRLASSEAPYSGLVVVDSNLTVDLLEEIAIDAALANADLRVAPASPGKAERLLPFLRAGRATLYVNLEEAGLLCGAVFDDSRTAADALLERGAARVLVTDGGEMACSANQATGLVQCAPPQVMVTRVTGAGDTFMAAHIAAEVKGERGLPALQTALAAAALFVSGGSPE